MTLRVVVGSRRRGGLVHDRRLARDDHLLARRRLEREVGRRRRVEADRRADFDRAEARQARQNPILAGRQGRDSIRPVGTRGRGPGPLQVRARSLDGGARQDGPDRVEDASPDRARRLPGDRWSGEEQERNAEHREAGNSTWSAHGPAPVFRPCTEGCRATAPARNESQRATLSESFGQPADRVNRKPRSGRKAGNSPRFGREAPATTPPATSTPRR